MNNRPTLGLLLASSLFTSACGDKATGQTVAVVNGEEITAGELNAELANANIPASANKEAVRAQVLQGLINRRLLAQQAREQGVDKSPEFLTKQRQMTEQLLIGLNAERQANTSRLPDQRAIDSFIQANPGMFGGRETWTLQQVQFATPTDANAVNRLKQAKTMDQLVATLSALQIPIQRGETRLDTATLPQEILRQINNLPATEPFIIPQGGRMIANLITARQPNPTPPEQSRQIALQGMRRQEADNKLKSTVEQLRASAKIEYQEGYAPKSDNAAKAKS